jgi:adenylate cyclase
MKRRISAILAADIVGYSKLVAEDEEETVRRLVVSRTVFSDSITGHGGLVVNTVGDAVLAEFPSSVDAVRCAMDVQESIRNRNLAYPPSRHMNFRIGITVGDVVDREGQLFGDGVNIAARLEGLAPSGGICVSRTVYEQAANKLSVKFEDIGGQQLKNIPEPIHAYMIVLHRGNAATVGNDAPKAHAPRMWSRQLAGAAAVVAAVATAGVVALQVYRPEQAPAVMEPPQTGQSSQSTASLVSQDPVRHFDEAKVRALATSQSIPLPRGFKVLAPGSTVPAGVAAYLGAWGGDKRWARGGRQAILVVESVDNDGGALGFYAQGAPSNPNAVARPARFASFAGSITEKGLVFQWGPSRFTFMIISDGSLWGRREAASEQGQFDLTIMLARIE